MKKVFILFACALWTIYGFAVKPEKELENLFEGMHVNEVKALYGEPIYSKYDKDSKIRVYHYNFYKKEGSGFAEYHIYFKDDKVTHLMQYRDKKEVPVKIYGDEAAIAGTIDGEAVTQKNYTIEGKSLVVTKILEGLTLTSEEIIDAVSVAIARACNGSYGEFKMKEPTRILYHGIIDKVITFDWIWGSINVYYTIDIAIKPGRIRIKVIGDEIDWHQDKDKATYYFSETFPIGDMPMKDVTGTESRNMIYITNRNFNHYISVIEEELNRTSGDDW